MCSLFLVGRMSGELWAGVVGLHGDGRLQHFGRLGRLVADNTEKKRSVRLQLLLSRRHKPSNNYSRYASLPSGYNHRILGFFFVQTLPWQQNSRAKIRGCGSKIKQNKDIPRRLIRQSDYDNVKIAGSSVFCFVFFRVHNGCKRYG